MFVKKQRWVWTSAFLCASGMALAEEQKSEPAVQRVDAVLTVVAEEVEEPESEPLAERVNAVLLSALARQVEEAGERVQLGIEGDQPPTTVQLLLNNLNNLVEAEKKTELGLEAETQGKFWIGLMCTAPSDVLRAQLDLAADVGLVVEQVSDNSPAKKAGIQIHDVLLSATIADKNEVRSLKNLVDLVTAVQAAQTAAMKVEFLRHGHKQTLEIVPAERPKQTQLGVNISVAEPSSGAVGLRWAGPMLMTARLDPLPDGMTIDFQPAEGQPEKVTVKKGDQVWTTEVQSLDKLPEGIGALVKQQLQQRNAHYARAFAYGTTTSGNVNFVAHAIAPTLPDDVTITTVRKGSTPAKVTLQKGDQTWDVTEKDLATIPAELRPFAAMALHGPVTGPAPFTKIISMPATPPVMKEIRVTEPRPVKVAVPATITQRPVAKTAKGVDRLSNQQEIERQLKELSEQVEKLRQAVEKTQPKQ